MRYRVYMPNLINKLRIWVRSSEGVRKQTGEGWAGTYGRMTNMRWESSAFPWVVCIVHLRYRNRRQCDINLLCVLEISNKWSFNNNNNPWWSTQSRHCNAIMNPYCVVDFKYDVWYCSVCGSRNRLPKDYWTRMRLRRIPEEMLPSSTTFEYILSSWDPWGSPRRKEGEP